MATTFEAAKNGILTNGNHVDLKSGQYGLQQNALKEETAETEPTNGDSAQPEEDVPEIDIEISNVVCSFSVKCHLNLREIALKGTNVEFRREQGMVTMKLRRPYTTASIWSSGKVTVTGATTEACAHIAARRVARQLQKIGFKTRFSHYRVVNVLGSCTMPFNIKIAHFSEQYRNQASYEPELHPGVTFRIKEPHKATLKIFSTGSITITGAPSVAAVQCAVEQIFPLVQPFRSERTAAQIEKMESRAELKRLRSAGYSKPTKKLKTEIDSEDDDEEEEEDESEEEDDD
ncbi:TATA box-binding protein-like 1 [Neocloeon triangulifer]|uniref:TATA box-binding protein-like 1 n=1 Tax=Neocloeon triangulifer TaxID=2078957 RepID=UPI00286F0D86|nr:TATA box-binding protein-like 1 [Neocloeon triangulifer]XP_059479364.1 TATA box-binding protein-like 1 [Neocloeon triangulifer]